MEITWLDRFQDISYLRADVLITAFMAVCMAISITFLFKLIGYYIKPYIPQKENIKKSKTTSVIKENYSVIMGMFVGYIVMFQYPIWAVVCSLAGGFFVYIGKKAYVWFSQKLNEEKKASEVLLLYEMISIYSSAGYSLYEALTVSLYLLDVIKKPLQRCLTNWSYGPSRALEKFRKELDVPEADVLVGIMQRAVVIGAANVASFLSHESETMERIRQYRVERRLGVRPVIQAIYLILPGLALIGVTLGPIGYHIAKTIMSIKLN
ncbi:hypothetical protein JOC37_001319 [Desulfohalotomaculum tongense]|uniref:hypothetical protein n=1 Tax=Desulforadius tongensis TaxID=1216062 RepID=UPI0019585D5F|nr:hypothetical protein [Desulforadius tongensis]MBM7854939.1 hypothetical protein [Desulforadius tongensis]